MGTTLYVGAEFNGFHGDFSLCDSFLNPDPLLYAANDLCYQPEVLLPTPVDDEFEFYQPPKRQKINCSDGLHYSNSSWNITLDHQLPTHELFHPTAETDHVQVPKQRLHYCNSSSDITFDYQYPAPAPELCYATTKTEKVPKDKKNVSAQSVAARQRRRKISEKTQKLGKLIPGGNRMNTAEMFHAAFKYIKFLQAQVGMLQLMQGKENEDDDEGLGLLLGSSSVHEKLYSEEKCLVPRKFVVDQLAKDDDLKLNPFVSKQIDLLVQKH